MIKGNDWATFAHGICDDDVSTARTFGLGGRDVEGAVREAIGGGAAFDSYRARDVTVRVEIGDNKKFAKATTRPECYRGDS